MKRYFILFVLLVFYALFWYHYFFSAKSSKSTSEPVQVPPSPQTVLGDTIVPSVFQLPSQYEKADITTRRQAFNLSCEFASAATVIYEYTRNDQFAPSNEKTSEEILFKQVDVSQNPNIGIRMGAPSTFSQLLDNMNHSFGGTDYYGVHAPAFIDLFARYNLGTKLILHNNDLVDNLKKALYGGHLVMTWIQIGHGKAIDADLSYGLTPVVSGEHTVVTYGYDQDAFLIMDPASGSKRRILYKDFLDSIAPFPLPFLEIVPSPTDLDNLILPDSSIGLLRKNLSIQIQNASGQVGEGSQMAAILKDFGYKTVGLSSLNFQGLGNVEIQIKKSKEDYLFLLKKDLYVSGYVVASTSSQLSDSNLSDAIITVGE